MIQKTNYSKYIGTAWQRRVLMTSLLSLTIGSSAIWAHSPNDAAVNSFLENNSVMRCAMTNLLQQVWAG